MKTRLVTFLLGMLTSMPLFADRGERGAWDYLNEDSSSSSVPLWFIALFAIVGYVAYNIFDDKKGESPRGCIATIIACFLLWLLLYAINH